MPEVNGPDIPFENQEPNYPEEFPEDSVIGWEPESQTARERCGDPDCETCYPDRLEETDIDDVTVTISAETERLRQQLEETQERFVSEIPIQGWSATTSASANIWTVGDESPSIDEEEDMPEINPEEEVVISESPATGETEEVRRILVPNIARVTFHNPRGSRMRVGTEIVNLDNRMSNYVVQITFWDSSGDAVRDKYRAFKEWCVENEVAFRTFSNDYFHEGNEQVNVPYYFTLCSANEEGSTNPEDLLTQPDCDCGEEIVFPSTKCPACEEALYCGGCRAFSSGIDRDDQFGSFCNSCSLECATCGTNYHGNQRECPGCHPRVRCHNCSTNMYVGVDQINEQTFEDEPDETFSYCNTCYPHLCYSCGGIVDVEDILEDQGHICVSCMSRNSFEEWTEDSMESEEIVIPTIPGREVIRLVGMEIEGANGEGLSGLEGGNILAGALYSAGLSRADMISGYHSSSGRRMSVHVERDSSVDWELVIGPMNVADGREVDIMNRSVRTVRSLINDGTLKLDMRAGMHVHVGADKVPFAKAYNLHKLYMFMEDFLYRLGAAKWPYHRSVNRRGRDQAGKSPITEGKLHFARTFTGNRYYGLSFDNYFARYFEGCQCGARSYGLFEECTCDLGKCTFEFRLFNTTANTVKIHAYLAICQALVAKAIELDEITDTSEYPALDFNKKRASDLHPSTRMKMNREWEKRIVFVNEQLPLTPEEKKSIHYCIMNSEMGKTVTNADILLETEDN